MRSTPSGNRVQIGVFGRRNVGKSSLLNALTDQTVSIVSDQPGTTTDPVRKPMELRPLGPVLLIDTAGIDDQGELGAARVARTKREVLRVDLALVVGEAGTWGPAEFQLLDELIEGGTVCFAVLNKTDLATPQPTVIDELSSRGIPTVLVSSTRKEGLEELRHALAEAVPEALTQPPPLIADLLPSGGLAVLVVPIDSAAPKGRIILPQVQAIRDLLDGGASCLVVTADDLAATLPRLASPPDIVVTDSQAFRQVADTIPPSVPLTSFSILFARAKGDLNALASGAAVIDRLAETDRVLIAESCSHKPTHEDIGRIKIPRLLRQRIGPQLTVDHVRGRDFPEDLSSWSLVIHCGACVWNRKSMLSRIESCKRHHVPITNYGLSLACLLGILPRALEPFPAALEEWTRQTRGNPPPFAMGPL